MFPSAEAAHAMTKVSELLTHFEVAPGTCGMLSRAEAGNPGDDLRLLAALPGPVVGGQLDAGHLGRQRPSYGYPSCPGGIGLEIGEAADVCSRRWTAGTTGPRKDPWKTATPPPSSAARTAYSDPSTSKKDTKERTLKFTQVLDQGDDGEFEVLERRGQDGLCSRSSSTRQVHFQKKKRNQ